MATTAAVASSRRMSAPSKTWPMSAWMPAGPVTWTSTPSGASSRSCVAEVLDLVDVVGVESERAATIAAVCPRTREGTAAPRRHRAVRPATRPAGRTRRPGVACALSVAFSPDCDSRAACWSARPASPGRARRTRRSTARWRPGPRPRAAARRARRPGCCRRRRAACPGPRPRARPPARTRSRTRRRGSARARRTRPAGVRRSPERARGVVGRHESPREMRDQLGKVIAN